MEIPEHIRKDLQRADQLRNHAAATARKVEELSLELMDHELVVKTIKDLEPSRKCFRLIKNVLVETTVEETLPVLNEAITRLKGLISQLNATIKQENAEANAIDEKHIEIRRAIMMQQQQQQQMQMQRRQQMMAQAQQQQSQQQQSQKAGGGAASGILA